eukprot:6555394-Prorocentrum_lima.AAC.1
MGPPTNAAPTVQAGHGPIHGGHRKEKLWNNTARIPLRVPPQRTRRLPAPALPADPPGDEASEPAR